MKPVEQKVVVRTQGERGSCLAACVASIFEVDHDDVWPGVYWIQELYTWTSKNVPGVHAIHRDFGSFESGVGFKLKAIPLDEVELPFSALPGATYWIATVISPRTRNEDGSPGLHAVVMKGTELAWDPHPQREMGFGDVCGMTWYEVVDPAKLIDRKLLAMRRACVD